MNNKINTLCFALMLSGSIFYAQEKQNKKAQESFDGYSYATAIEQYEKLIDQGYSKKEIYQNLGDANYNNANYAEAASWYSKLYKEDISDVDNEYMYKYAQSLKSTQEYDAADAWMQKFNAAKSGDVRAIKFADHADYLEEIEKQSGRYDINNLAINSSASDFAPAFSGENLIFSTARDSGMTSRNIHNWNNEPFLNLYSASPSAESGSFASAAKLDRNANKKTHESSAIFTKKGDVVYFTRNNSENGNFSRDEGGVSRLKIYRANVANDTWTNIIELPFNSDEYSCAHPTLSPDETTLYFASDMPGTVGQSDIFSVNLLSDGSIGAPVNLGNVINTEGRETFPFVTSENVLYFASDGHQGLGGLDVFATKIEDKGNLNIVNIGKPINSAQDDFAFILNDETSKGFFSSNREGGKGSDDIYSFTENEKIDLNCTTLVSGIVKDEETGQPLAGAKVSILNSAKELISEAITGTDGSFNLDGDCEDGEYTVAVSKDAYDDNGTIFTTVKSSDTDGIEVVLSKTIKRAAPGVNLVLHLNLRPVNFDLDKDFIRPDAARTIQKVLEYLQAFPDVKVQVQSHTDVKASTRYNENLSKRRAKNTVAYMIANGLDASRVTGEGFGETRITNECTTRHSCPDERHEENRRSEFIVIQ